MIALHARTITSFKCSLCKAIIYAKKIAKAPVETGLSLFFPE